MEIPKIDRILIDNLELIDSRTINVFYNTFGVQVENIQLLFEFIDRRENASADIEKINADTYHIKVYNFPLGGLKGVFKPLEIGVIDDTLYCFSLIGLAASNPDYKCVSFNLFKENKNAKD